MRYRLDEQNDAIMPLALGLVAILVMTGFGWRPHKEDGTGKPFTEFYTPEKERLCCENCLQYEASHATSCYEVIKQHGGARQCHIFLQQAPHTIAQCQQVMHK